MVIDGLAGDCQQICMCASGVGGEPLAPRQDRQVVEPIGLLTSKTGSFSSHD